MELRVDRAKRFLCFAFLTVLLASGCALSPAGLIGPKYYLIDIPSCSLAPEALVQTTERSGNEAAVAPGPLSQPNDRRIVECAERVKLILRERFNNARLARTGGGAIQVLTAAVSSIMTGVMGANALTAATILSGTSAVMPEMSEVIEAKGRAEAYTDALKSIERAEAAFLKVMARSHKGKISETAVTPAGAELYDKVRVSIAVMEARLSAQLPSVEELQKLTSRPLTLSGREIKNWKPGSTEQVFATSGGPIVHAESSDLNVATVDIDPGGGSIKIKGVAAGEAEITAENEAGGSASVKVMPAAAPPAGGASGGAAGGAGAKPAAPAKPAETKAPGKPPAPGP